MHNRKLNLYFFFFVRSNLKREKNEQPKLIFIATNTVVWLEYASSL